MHGSTAVSCRCVRTHARIAREHGTGFILESATWRASADWGEKLGYSAADLAEANVRSVAMLADLRRELETAGTTMVVSGCIGPRGDGYDPGRVMTAIEAEDYHGFQARIFAGTAADQMPSP